MWPTFVIVLVTRFDSIHTTDWATDGRLVFWYDKLHIARFTDVFVPDTLR